jgi:hypothetical protein
VATAGMQKIYREFRWKTLLENPPGRLSRRWCDNITMDITEMGYDIKTLTYNYIDVCVCIGVGLK